MRSVLVLIVWLAATTSAQEVLRQVIANATTATTSAPITNNSQTAHELYVTYTNSGGTCSPSNSAGFVQLEASFDGANYLAITAAPLLMTPLPAGNGYHSRLTAAGGPYKGLRIRLYANAPANCVVNAFYAGSKTPVSYPQTMTAMSGQFRQISNIASGVASHLVVAPASIDSSKRYAVYALVVSNTDTSAALRVTFTEETAGCTGTTVQTYGVYTLPPAGPPMVLGGSTAPWFIASSTGTSLCAAFAGTSPAWSISATYRLEQ